MIANANNPTATARYPYTLGQWRTPGYRAQRLEHLLKANPATDVAAMTRIQNDSVSVAARDLLATLLKTAPRSEIAGRVHALMRGWDGTMARTIPQPLIFIAWLRALDRRLLADELGELYAQYGGLHTQTIKTVLGRATSWCDDKSTPAQESCDDQVTASLANCRNGSALILPVGSGVRRTSFASTTRCSAGCRSLVACLTSGCRPTVDPTP